MRPPETAFDHAVLSPHGDVLALAENGGGLSLLSTTTGKQLWKAPTSGQVIAPVFAPDGKTLAFCLPEERGMLRLIDAATGKGVRQFKTGDSATSPMMMPDGSAVITVPLTFPSDGALLIGGSLGRRLALWETSTGKLRRRLRVAFVGNNWAGGASRCVMATPDGPAARRSARAIALRCSSSPRARSFAAWTGTTRRSPVWRSHRTAELSLASGSACDTDGPDLGGVDRRGEGPPAGPPVGRAPGRVLLGRSELDLVERRPDGIDLGRGQSVAARGAGRDPRRSWCGPGPAVGPPGRRGQPFSRTAPCGS